MYKETNPVHCKMTTEIFQICEKALNDIKHAKSVMNDPYAPQQRWPITLIEDSEKILTQYNIESYEPCSTQFPLLHTHILSLKEKRTLKEEQNKILQSPEYQLQEKKNNLISKKGELESEHLRLKRLMDEIEFCKGNIYKLQTSIMRMEAELSI
jgi:hypothetical protein